MTHVISLYDASDKLLFMLPLSPEQVGLLRDQWGTQASDPEMIGSYALVGRLMAFVEPAPPDLECPA